MTEHNTAHVGAVEHLTADVQIGEEEKYAIAGKNPAGLYVRRVDPAPTDTGETCVTLLVDGPVTSTTVELNAVQLDRLEGIIHDAQDALRGGR